MVDVAFRPPHERDVVELATHMRAGDRAELAALGIDDLLAAVWNSVRTSPFCWAGLADGKVLGIFGVAPLRKHLLLEDTGAPWMLATPEADRHARLLVTGPAPYIARMLEAYPRLVNFVHADNRRAVRWLQRLGFKLDDPVPFGPLGAPFHRFEMRRHV